MQIVSCYCKKIGIDISYIVLLEDNLHEMSMSIFLKRKILSAEFLSSISIIKPWPICAVTYRFLLHRLVNVV